MVRNELRIALIDGVGDDREELEADYNLGLEQFHQEHPGVRILGMEVVPMESREAWTIRGIIQYEVTISEPEPEPEAGPVLEAEYSRSLNTILSLASNISAQRQAGLRGEGMNYGKFWEKVDRLGQEFANMGDLVGGVPDATDPPPQG